jgi:hypothetical protein
MYSIKSSGPKSLKPIDPDTLSDRPSVQTDDPHSSLMASIRSGATLKKAPTRSEKQAESPTESANNGDPTDMMAAMLAKALAARNKKLSMESDEDSEESDDSRW